MSEKDVFVFQLEPDEEYNERCGEVFITNFGYLVFHCTLCDMKFKGFGKFSDHVRDEHLLSSTFSDNFLNSEMTKLNYDYDCTYDYNLSDIQNSKNNNKDYSGTNLSQILESSSCHIETVSLSTNDKKMCTDVQKEKFRPIRKINPTRIRIPAEERKYKCHICGAGFKDKNNRNHHVIRHSDVKKFPCSECEKTFYTTTERRVHFRIHTQERPFLCSECGQSFTTNVYLVNHVKRHKNQRDYHCPDCEKVFFDQKLLTAHMFVHSKKKPHECKICNSGYINRRSLLIHMKKHKNF